MLISPIKHYSNSSPLHYPGPLTFAAASVDWEDLNRQACQYLHEGKRWEFNQLKAQFDRAKRSVNLENVQINGFNRQGFNLSGITIRRLHLTGRNLKGANLQLAKFEDAYLDGVNLEKANLEGTVFDYSSLTELLLSSGSKYDNGLKNAVFLYNNKIHKNIFDGIECSHRNRLQVLDRLLVCICRERNIPGITSSMRSFRAPYYALELYSNAYDFGRYTLDASRGPDKSQIPLLSSFGFKKAAEDNPLLGPTFYLTAPNVSPTATIALGQYGILVSEPTQGTLIIPNFSEDVWDKHQIHTMGWYKPQYTSCNQLATLSKTDFRPLLVDPFGHSPLNLLGIINKIKADYRRWKFEPTLKDRNGQSSVHTSPGFKHIVEYCLAWEKSYTHSQIREQPITPPPTLAFINPHPPFSTTPLTPKAIYPYSADHGREMYCFLQWLKQDGTAKPSDFVDLLKFIKEGLNFKDPELVMLPQKAPR